MIFGKLFSEADMLKTFFEKEKIEYFSELSISDVTIWDENKFSRMQEEIGKAKSVVVFLIPYDFGQKTTNLSVYAQVKDYHLYIRELSGRFGEYLSEEKIQVKFKGFSDSSPLAERDAALSAGLCVLGKNGLCINEKYGSFFFIGAFFLTEEFAPMQKAEKRGCIACGKCEKACPEGAIKVVDNLACLSLLSQKKVLTREEEILLEKAECKWGCDLCQNVCPENQKREKTPIPFFQTDHISTLSEKEISLPKKEFLTRAFSWRGREILRRNLGMENEKIEKNQ